MTEISKDPMTHVKIPGDFWQRASVLIASHSKAFFACTAIASIGSYLLYAEIFGLDVFDVEFGGLFPLLPGAWTAFIFSLSLAHIVTFNAICRVKVHEDMLATAHDTKSRKTIEFHYAAFLNHRHRKKALIIGSLVSLLVTVFALVLAVFGLSEYMTAAEILLELGWFFITVPVVFWVIAHATIMTFLTATTLMKDYIATLKIDLFNLENVEPFIRIAMRYAVGWVAMGMITSLLFINLPMDQIVTPPLIMILTITSAGVGYYLPIRAIHRAISSKKKTHLRNIRKQLVTLATKVEQGSTDGQDDINALQTLLALEARIERVREWPIDMPAMGRIGLLLFIPLGSWLGGALVERLVDRFF